MGGLVGAAGRSRTAAPSGAIRRRRARYAPVLLAALAMGPACSPAPGDDQPLVITYECEGLGCEFDVAGEAPRVTGSWKWSFGDGATSTSQNPSHVYAAAGSFDVAVTATPATGAPTTNTVVVTVVRGEADSGEGAPPGFDLSYRATEPGRYTTRFDHIGPAFSFAIADGWWATDTLTAVSVGNLAMDGTSLCDPLVRIIAPEGRYDPVDSSVVPFGDIADTLLADPRFEVSAVADVVVGGRDSVRIDTFVEEDRLVVGDPSPLNLEKRLRRCGDRVRTMFPIAAPDLADPVYRWIWMPVGSAGLSFWIVPGETSDVLIAASFESGGADAFAAVDSLVESIEFLPTEEPRPTKTLRSEFGDIEILAGTTRLHSLVDWAVGQFAESGIGSPEVERVTFAAFAACHDHSYSGGFARLAVDRSEVYLCFEDERDPAAARMTVLHEFAHAWMGVNRGALAESRFLDSLRLQNPLETAEEAEYAADIIAWGLFEGTETPRRLVAIPCDRLGEAFDALAGVEPLRDVDECSPAESAGEP